MDVSQNIDRLSQAALDLVALFFERVMVGGLLPCHTVEVRLDDPVSNLLDGNGGLHTHGGSGSACYLKRVGDPGWAIVTRFGAGWDAETQTAMAHRAAEAHGIDIA